MPLRLSVLSKADRALAIADGTVDQVKKAQRIDLTEDMSVAEGFTAIVMSRLQHFRWNERIVAKGRDPEALHQLRVAMRRSDLRSVSFGPSCGKAAGSGCCPKTCAGRAGRWAKHETSTFSSCCWSVARWTTSRSSGSARKATTESWRCSTPALPRDDAEPRPVVVHRQVARTRPKSATARQLRRAPTAEGLGTAGGRAVPVQDEGKAAAPVPPAHEEVRYALEFLRSINPGAKHDAKPFHAALEALQDELGQLNDMVIAKRLAAAGGIPADGLIDEGARAGMLERIDRRYAELLAIGPYWRPNAPRRPEAAAARRQDATKPPAASRRRGPRSAGSAPG